LYFDNSLRRNSKEEAKLLHESGINEGQGIGFLLTSEREVCRSCKKKLRLDQNVHVVVGYHVECRAVLGLCVTKFCSCCKIYEHYGFWSKDDDRCYEGSALHNEYLLISEDTAIHVTLLRRVRYISKPASHTKKKNKK